MHYCRIGPKQCFPFPFIFPSISLIIIINELEPLYFCRKKWRLTAKRILHYHSYRCLGKSHSLICLPNFWHWWMLFLILFLAVCFHWLKEEDEKAGQPSPKASNDEKHNCMNRRRIRSKCKCWNLPSRNFLSFFFLNSF